MIIGSLVLASKGSPTALHWFQDKTMEGKHVPGRQNGQWWLSHDVHQEDIYLPHRDKHIGISYVSEGCGPSFLHKLTTKLGTLDADYPSFNQLRKYHCVQEHLVDALVNPTDGFLAIMNNEGTHGSWGFLSYRIPLYFFAVYGQGEVQLIWSDNENSIDEIRGRYPLKYSIYRFPVLLNKPLFISTQAVCSKWWRWTAADRNDTLLHFNALELMVFRSVLMP